MATSISHAMDFLESCDMQTLVDTLHKYFEYEQCLKQFMLAKIEHKEQVKQQRLGFVAKHLKEFDVANATILEAIKCHWSFMWHIFANDKCLSRMNTPNSHGLSHDMRHKKYVLCSIKKHALLNVA